MRVPAYELPPPGTREYVTNWVGLTWESLACEKLAQVNVGVNCVRAALEGHRRAGTAAHGAGAVYAGVFSTPQTEAGTRWIPLSDTALTLFTNRGRRAEHDVPLGVEINAKESSLSRPEDTPRR